MAIDKANIGNRYGPCLYEVGSEKMREFAYAVSGGVPSMGFTGRGPPADLLATFWRGSEIVAFPSFCNVFAIAPFGQAVTDPKLGINLMNLVHGEQDYEFFEPVRPHDLITSTGEITDIFTKQGKDFLTVVTESKNQRDQLVVRGKWLAVIREG